MTEAQLRKMIRKEILKEMGQMGEIPPEQEKEDVFRDFKDPMKVSAGVGLAVGGNAIIDFLQKHPGTTEPLMDLLKALAGIVQE